MNIAGAFQVCRRSSAQHCRHSLQLLFAACRAGGPMHLILSDSRCPQHARLHARSDAAQDMTEARMTAELDELKLQPQYSQPKQVLGALYA